MKNILLFGSTGYVGTHFIERNIKKYNIIEVGRREFDFLDPDIDSLVKSLRNKKSYGMRRRDAKRKKALKSSF